MIQSLNQGLAAEPLAQLRGVHKHFGRIQALNDIDLEVRQGEVVALLGPNGAGKTTAISILLGRRRPDQGQVRLFGHDPVHPRGRTRIGSTPQETGFPKTLKVGEIIELVRCHYPDPLPLAGLLKRFGLTGLEHRQAGGLSSGQQRRLAVALAFAGNPGAVFLDEPTTGLDVEARRALWQAIREYALEGGTVLLTTHHMEEAETLATRVVFINQGRVVAAGPVEAIKARMGLKQVRFRAETAPQLPGVVRREEKNGIHTLYTADADELVRHLVHQQIHFKDLEVFQVSLEEAFLLLTGGSR